MTDFTPQKHRELILALRNAGYSFQTFEEYIKNPASKSVVLRHDVDDKPENSLRFGKIQHELGIKGVYYFRAVKKSWDEDIILQLHALGHEIGYHYETMAHANGNIEKAYSLFQENLQKLRKLVPVSTICMHGSPLSKFDNKELWKQKNYKDLGIIAEPYFDVDFNKVLYFTDTGMSWQNKSVSIRDKVNGTLGHPYSSTDEIIQALEKNELNHHLMFNFHPQRWNEGKLSWYKEFILQNIKNKVKFVLNKLK